MVTDKDLAWCAGYFDGEGSVNAYWDHRFPNTVIMGASLPNTCLPSLYRLQRMFGGSVKGHNGLKAQLLHPKWRPCYRWRISGERACDFFKSIHPYLDEKGPQVDTYLELRQTKDHGRRRILVERLKRLKHVSYYLDMPTSEQEAI